MSQKMINAIRVFLILVAVQCTAFGQTAGLLPNAVQQFFDGNGNPLTSGTVTTYVPNTTTLKTTWQDASELIANTNPIVLNASGRAIIYGDGNYRQIVRDRNGNLIWDAVTSATGAGGATLFGDGTSVGTILSWSGLVAPTRYVFAYGQELSRVTYSTLFTTLTVNSNVSCTSGSPILTGLSDTTQFALQPAVSVEASCIPAGSHIISKTSTTVTLNNNANITSSAVAKFFPYGNGNGTTTFNIPDLRGRVLAGRDNMGGTPANNLTVNFFAAPGTGAAGGGQSVTLVTSNLPAYTPTGSNAIADPGHTHFLSNSDTVVSTPITTSNFFANQGQQSGSSIAYQFTGSTTAPTLALSSTRTTGVTSAFTGVAQGGSSNPFTIVQPTITLNYIIKVLPDVTISTLNVVSSIEGMTGDLTCTAPLTCAGQVIGASGMGSGTVIGPSTSAVGNLAVWNDIFGTVLADGGAPPINIQAPPYNAVGNCVADDTVAIQAAITAAEAGGGLTVLIPPVANCFLVTSELTITKRITIIGTSWSRAIDAGGSIIKTNSSTANVFNIPETINGVTFNNFAIGSTVIKTAGAGVRITCLTCASSLVPFAIYFNQMGIFDQFIGIDGENVGGVWINNSTIINQTGTNAIGLLLARPQSVDAGEHWISNNQFEGNSTFTGIKWISGGGVRITGNKFLTGNIGLLISTATGVNTVTYYFNIIGNSFDTQTSYAIRAINANVGDSINGIVIASNNIDGPAGTLVSFAGTSATSFGLIDINSNVLLKQSGGEGINITGASQVLIDTNLMNSDASGTAITIGTVTNFRLGLGNLFNGWGTNVTGGGYTNGSIIFTTSNMPAQDTNLFWDVTNHRLGIGNATPQTQLGVKMGDAVAPGSLATWLNSNLTLFGDAGNANGKAVGIGYDGTNSLGRLYSAQAGTNFTDMAYGALTHQFFAGTTQILASKINTDGSTTLGLTGTTLGVLNFSGNTTGLISVKGQAAAGTYNFNLPTTAGTSGQVLTSAGGVAAPMTWTTATTGTVTSIATTGPITGGTITSTGTIACATCVTSAGSLTANSLMIGSGLQASAVTTTGTGVLTALGINVGSTGAFVTFNGAGGTPSSITLTNGTGLPTTGLTGTLQAAQEPAHTGDVTNSAGSLALTIANSAVTYAKIQNLGALALMGRSANSSGVGADIQATAASDAVMRESGSTIGFGTIATGGIANNAVTLAKLATQATNTVLGNATSGTAVPTALAVGTCSTAASALIWTTNTGFGCNTSITANAVPAANLTGATLASGVTASSLTSLGTITSLTATTINAFTLGGTISGGGNQINNVIIGTTTPLAGSFTTITATGSIQSSGPNQQIIANRSAVIGGFARLELETAGVESWSFGLRDSSTDLQIYDEVAAAKRIGIDTSGNISLLGNGILVGAPTGGGKGLGTINFAGTLWTNGTQGLASKTCTINTANAATGITITITNGIITATTTC